MSGAEIVLLNPEHDMEFDIFKPITKAQIEEAILKNPDIEAVYLTSPTFEGMVCDYQQVRETVGEQRLLIVDEAHGSHLYFDKNTQLGSQQSEAVDMSINSLHKNVGGLSGLALINIGKNCRLPIDYVRDMYLMLSTTSINPYFLFDCEGALRFMDSDDGHNQLQTCYSMRNQLIQDLKTSCSHNMKIMPDYMDGARQDFTKLVLKIPGLTGGEIYRKLEEKGIEAEKYTEQGLVITMHTNINDQECNHLAESLKAIANEKREYNPEVERKY